MKIITSLSELRTIISSGEKSTLMIGGALVYATQDKATAEGMVADGNYVMQPPRPASRGRLFEQAKTSLFVSVQDEAANLLADFGPVAFLADHYLAYGLAQSSDTIVIGGSAEGSGAVTLEIMVFSGKRLVETVERRAELSSLQLDLAVRDVLEAYPAHSVHWCCPLSDPPICDLSQSENFVEVGTAPIKSIIRKKVFAKQQDVDESSGWVPAIAIVCLSGAIFAGVTAWEFSGIDRERGIYQKEVAGFEKVYSTRAQSLDLLRHRDTFLNTPPAHLARIRDLDSLLAQVAHIPGVQISRIEMFDRAAADSHQVVQGDNGDGTGLADFRLEISVPQESGTSARDQAEPLLAQLNHTTGMTFRLIDHSERKEGSGSGSVAFWQYRLTGTMERARGAI
ncbi:hypothetical protein [Pseudomonas sp. GM_Psu_2]|uniref:hypothetical protein n=1 Tax=unclassified Pseudomonas TaxID=196821 RepID=UPI00226998B8|nr:hypothetical protein [Pseudomonas sp. GM_Psu_2]